MIARAEVVFRLDELVRESACHIVGEVLALAQTDANRFDARALFDDSQDIADRLQHAVRLIERRQHFIS